MMNARNPQRSGLFGFVDVGRTGVRLARDMHRATTDNGTAASGNTEFG